MSLYGSVGASSVRGAHPLPTGPAPSRKRKDRDDPDARPGSSNYYHYYNNNNNNGSTPSPPLSSSSSSSTSSPSSFSLLGLPRPPHVRQPPLVEQRLGKQLLSPNSVAAPIPAVAAPANTPTLAKPGGNRLLMAGYLAHEFLSRGTLFGRPYGTSGGGGAAAFARKEEMQQKRKQQYEEVARILWGGGAHVPGVINPTQLGAWLQKQQEK